MNLILDTVRCIDYNRPFTKIVIPANERKAPGSGGIAEIQSALHLKVMVKHLREADLGRGANHLVWISRNR